MGNIYIKDLPIVEDLGLPPGTDDVLLICNTSTGLTKRFTVEALLKSIPVKDLFEHILRRLKERKGETQPLKRKGKR